MTNIEHFEPFVIRGLYYKECVLDVFIYLMTLHQSLESNSFFFLLFSVVTVALPDESQK